MNEELIKKFENYLRTPKGTLSSFRLDLSVNDAYRLLLAAYQGEVSEREQCFRSDAASLSALSMIASALVNPSGKFGIILLGNVGNGKTTALRALQKVINRLRIPDIRCAYRITHLSLPIYRASSLVEMWEQNPEKFRTTTSAPLLGIDELGEENVDVRRYGNFASPICDLIYQRYDRRLFTAISTNLGASSERGSIRERYGDRIADRLNEMMHKVVFKAHSFRT